MSAIDAAITEPLKIRHFSVVLQRIFVEIGTFSVKNLATNSITNNFVWLIIPEAVITHRTVVHFCRSNTNMRKLFVYSNYLRLWYQTTFIWSFLANLMRKNDVLQLITKAQTLIDTLSTFLITIADTKLNKIEYYEAVKRERSSQQNDVWFIIYSL